MTSERADSFSDVQCIGLRFQPHRNAAFGRISVLERRYNFGFLEAEELCYLCGESKGADQLHCVTAQLLCAFVFAYAKSRFSHDAANIIFNMNASLTYGL